MSAIAAEHAIQDAVMDLQQRFPDKPADLQFEAAYGFLDYLTGQGFPEGVAREAIHRYSYPGVR